MNLKVILASAVTMFLVCHVIAARQPLTFEERVKAQEAIERVYYNHRIWPKENPTPKPLFENLVTQEALSRQAGDPLRMSAALSSLYGDPVTPEQLQAEMNRPNPAMELQRCPQMPMSTSFSQNGRSPKRDWGAIEPKAKRAPKGGGPSGWLCQRRGREWPSQSGNKGFLFRRSTTVAEGIPLPSRNLGTGRRSPPKCPTACANSGPPSATTRR